MFNDLRYATRILLKKPGFTLTAILSLALGIGANTAIFSLLDAVMLKSLPVAQPDRLVLFGNGKDQGATDDFPSRSFDLFSYPFYRRVQKDTEIFSGVASVLSIPWDVHGTVASNQSSGDLEKIKLQPVSGTYFTVLGVNPVTGRVFSDADDQMPGANPVIVLSNAYWQRRFGGDPQAVGKAITIDGVAYTVVGVVAPEFFGTTVGEAPDVWVPLAMEQQLPPAHWKGRDDPEFQSLFLIGRLQDGVSSEQATAAMNLEFKRMLQERAGSQPSSENLNKIQKASIELTPVGKGLSQLRREFALSLKVLMGVVFLVLIISCANVANLLLAHGSARRKEFALRLALGASRLRLTRQLLTESLVIAFVGGLLGVGLAWWGSSVLLVIASADDKGLPLNVGPNVRVLGFTLAASILSAVTFGVAPALKAIRLEPNTTLKGGRGAVETSVRNPFGKMLVVAQVALSLLLLIGAGLFVRTLINLRNVPSGFNQEHVLLFHVDTSTTGFKEDDPRLSAVLSNVEQAAKNVSGVQSAAFSFFVFNQGAWTTSIITDDQNKGSNGRNFVRNNVVGNQFFDALGIPLLAGRKFNSQDTERSPKVAIVSELMAKNFFPNGSALGRHFGMNGPKSGDQIEIVGIAKDAKYGSLTEEIRPMVYYPHTQRPTPLVNFVVRYLGTEESITQQIRQTIKQVNPNLPIDEVVSLSDYVDRSLVQQKLIAKLSSFFGLLALLLSCVGLYGVMSYAVAQRTQEIGIRMAVGAQSRNVLWMVLREVFKLVVIGLVLGVLVSLASTRTAASLLFGLKATDPATIVFASAVLLIISLFAGYLPARRAASVDPMVALRDE